MYSRRVIDSNLELLEQKLGYTPIYHSLADCLQAIDRFNRFVDEEGNLTRTLSRDDIRWIENERELCRVDFEYWRSRYCKIVDWNSKLVLMTPNLAQRIISDVYADFENRGVGVQMLFNKARQLGVTHDTEVRILHKVQFLSNVNAVVASSDPEKSAKMATIMEKAYWEQPWWLRPEITKYKSGVLIEFGRQNSAISIQHGAQFTGIARGTTPNIAHLSEVSDFEEPDELIDASLLMAMHPTPETFLVLESTSKGMENWWHDNWILAKEKWHLGQSRLRPVFLPWFVGVEIWPTPTDELEHPIPDGWIPSDLVKHHAERCRQYVLSTPLLKKHLGEDWQLPLRQQWYYWWKREEMRAKRELNKFLEEMPADDQEAFQVSGISVFDVDTLDEHHKACKEPIGVYGFQAHESLIPLRLQPARHDIDPDQPPIDIISRWSSTAPSTHITLAPLKRDVWYEGEGRDRLFIWRWPEDNQRFGLGVDASEGIGHDQSVIEVLSVESMTEWSEQCAEYASRYCNPVDLWPMTLAIATLYSTKLGNELKQARVTLEVRNEADVTQLELKKNGWRNFHPWFRIDSRRIQPGKAHKEGWFTNSWSRRQIMAYLIKNIRDSTIVINSSSLIKELKSLHRDEAEQSLRAIYGAFDDRVMAIAFNWFSLHWDKIAKPEGLQAIRDKHQSGEPNNFVRHIDNPAFTLTDEDWNSLAGVGYQP